MKVWWRDEFDQMDDADREDSGWRVPDEVGIFDPSFRYPCKDVGEAAEKYADYFLSERDGHENSWPVGFVVFDGERYYDVSVELEYEPAFNAATPTARAADTTTTEETADA